MHITIPTVGSRGDVQPFVALGESFKQAGHQVQLATHYNCGTNRTDNLTVRNGSYIRRRSKNNDST